MIRSGAILTLTFLFAALIPFAGVVIVLTPLPVLYTFSRLDRLRGFAVLFVSYLATFGIVRLSGQHASLPVLFMIGFTGVLLFEILKRRASIEKTFLLALSALFCCGAGFILYHSFRAGVAPWQMVELHVAEIVREYIIFYAQLMNLPEEQARLIREVATYFFTVTFPALALSGAVFTIWVNLLAGRRLFRMHGIAFPDFGDLAAWKAPEKFVWMLIAGGGMVFVTMEEVAVVGMNLLIISGTIYLLQGLAIVAFFFRQKQVPLFFRWLFYFLIFVQLYLLIIVIAVGLFDLWVDFRKRIGGMGNVPA
jgi:uncharacterized protein YybS (DUF2232 family)